VDVLIKIASDKTKSLCAVIWEGDTWLFGCYCYQELF